MKSFKNPIRIFSIIAVSLLTFSSMDAQIIHLEYVDINNNTYKISSTEVEYIPIKASESSSGMYSGGEPWKKKIDKKTFDEINKLFTSVINDKSRLLEKRVKPSIILSVQKGKQKEENYIAKTNEKLDAYVKNLSGKK